MARIQPVSASLPWRLNKLLPIKKPLPSFLPISANLLIEYPLILSLKEQAKKLTMPKMKLYMRIGPIYDKLKLARIQLFDSAKGCTNKADYTCNDIQHI